MITALCEPDTPARSSARSRSGSASPPIARPPILRNDRRETPSQYRRSAPNKVIIGPSPWNSTRPGRRSTTVQSRLSRDPI